MLLFCSVRCLDYDTLSTTTTNCHCLVVQSINWHPQCLPKRLSRCCHHTFGRCSVQHTDSTWLHRLCQCPPCRWLPAAAHALAARPQAPTRHMRPFVATWVDVHGLLSCTHTWLQDTAQQRCARTPSRFRQRRATLAPRTQTPPAPCDADQRHSARGFLPSYPLGSCGTSTPLMRGPPGRAPPGGSLVSR